MKYRDMLGFPKKKEKKQTIPEEPKPSVTEVLKEEFGPTAKAFGDKNVGMKTDTGPKRWTGSGLTEYEQAKINEGPAYEYANQISKIEKLYDVYWDAVKDLGRALEKKGQRKLSKELFNNYRKQVSKFSQWFSKFSGGLM